MEHKQMHHSLARGSKTETKRRGGCSCSVASHNGKSVIVPVLDTWAVKLSLESSSARISQKPPSWVIHCGRKAYIYLHKKSCQHFTVNRSMNLWIHLCGTYLKTPILVTIEHFLLNEYQFTMCFYKHAVLWDMLYHL